MQRCRRVFQAEEEAEAKVLGQNILFALLGTPPSLFLKFLYSLFLYLTGITPGISLSSCLFVPEEVQWLLSGKLRQITTLAQLICTLTLKSKLLLLQEHLLFCFFRGSSSLLGGRSRNPVLLERCRWQAWVSLTYLGIQINKPLDLTGLKSSPPVWPL